MGSTARASYEKRRSRRWRWRSLLLYHAVWSGTCLPTLIRSLLPCEGRRLIWKASKLTTNYTASPIPLLIHTNVELVRNLMAHAQKPHFVFRLNGRVHLNRRESQVSRLLAAEVCASALTLNIPRGFLWGPPLVCYWLTSVEINKHKIFDTNNAWITELEFQKPKKT